ncbi:hypothetical protein [Caballeronia arvi]|uniref:hypothetical protein n=1 Tax=Caballeronia arvi TaxID=1777135 RepID=UPI00117DF702|nr:hypothetical protein [Caballeronia arvi]
MFVPTAGIAVTIALVPALSAIAPFAWPIGFITAAFVYFMVMGCMTKRPIAYAEDSGELTARE